MTFNYFTTKEPLFRIYDTINEETVANFSSIGELFLWLNCYAYLTEASYLFQSWSCTFLCWMTSYLDNNSNEIK